MFEHGRYNQYKCTSANCFYSSAEVVNIIDHLKIIYTIDPVFNFECVNRLPIRCRRKFLTILGLEKHLKKGVCGSSVAMIMVQFEDSLCQRPEVQISIRSSYSEKIFNEKKKFDDLWAHYQRIPLPTI